jgi:ESAT-6 family protein
MDLVVNGEITVAFDDIEGAAAAVRAVAGNVDTLLADLRIMLRPLAAEWDGAAALNYQYQQQVWDSSAEDLHGVLLRIAAVLENSHGSYTGAESDLRNLWSGA